MAFIYKNDIYVGKSKRKRTGFVDDERGVMLVGWTRNSSGVEYHYFIFQDEIFELTKREIHKDGKTIYEFGSLSKSRESPVFQENKDAIRALIKEAVLAEQEWMWKDRFDASIYLFQFRF